MRLDVSASLRSCSLRRRTMSSWPLTSLCCSSAPLRSISLATWVSPQGHLALGDFGVLDDLGDLGLLLRIGSLWPQGRRIDEVVRHVADALDGQRVAPQVERLLLAIHPLHLGVGDERLVQVGQLGDGLVALAVAQGHVDRDVAAGRPGRRVYRGEAAGDVDHPGLALVLDREGVDLQVERRHELQREVASDDLGPGLAVVRELLDEAGAVLLGQGVLIQALRQPADARGVLPVAVDHGDGLEHERVDVGLGQRGNAVGDRADVDDAAAPVVDQLAGVRDATTGDLPPGLCGLHGLFDDRAGKHGLRIGVVDRAGGEVVAEEGVRDRLRHVGHERVAGDLLLVEQSVADMHDLPELLPAAAGGVDPNVALGHGDHLARFVRRVVVGHPGRGVLFPLHFLDVEVEVVVRSR